MDEGVPSREMGDGDEAAAAYVRMSTDHQKYSIGNQLAAIDRWCAANRARIVRVYTDAGRSGVALENRPGLKQLLADAHAGVLPFSRVVVLDVSRFGRFQNIDEGAYYEQVLKRAGAPVVYCAEPFTAEAGSVASIFKVVKRAMAAEFSRELSRKVAAGVRNRARDGRFASSSPGYGYRRVLRLADGRAIAAPAGRLQLDGASVELQPGPEAEQAAVRRLFGLYAVDGLSPAAIAGRLQAEDWPRPLAGAWSASTVRYILDNEKYAGVLVYGRRPSAFGRAIHGAAAAELVRVPGAYPAIVSPALFRLAQARRRAARRPWIWDRSELIEGLRRLHEREGMVTKPLIDADPALPSSETVRRKFGSFSAASAAAGLPVRSPAHAREHAKRLKRAKLPPEPAT